MAAIIESGEAVVDRQIDQLVVIFRLETRAGEEFDGVVADADLVAVVQFLAADRLAIEIRAIGRTKILEEIAIAIARYLAMMPRHTRMLQRQRAFARAADGDRFVTQLDLQAEHHSADDDKTRLERAVV